MKILKQITYFILLILITLLCIYNRSEKSFEIPFYREYNVPLYFVIIFSCIAGIIIGSLNSYFKSVRQSFLFRKLEDENEELSQKINIYEVDEKLRSQAKTLS